MAMCNGDRRGSSPPSCLKKPTESAPEPSLPSCLKLSSEAYNLKKDGSNHSHNSVMSSEGGTTSGSSSAQSCCWSEDTDVSGSRLNIESSEELLDLVEDKEIAARAVAFVVNSTRKGIVPLCADVASLMRTNRRLEKTVARQRRELELLKRGINTSSVNDTKRGTSLTSDTAKRGITRRPLGSVSDHSFSSVSASEQGSTSEQGLFLGDASVKVFNELDEMTSQALSQSDASSDYASLKITTASKILPAKSSRPAAAPSRGLRRTTTLSSGLLLDPCVLASAEPDTSPPGQPPGHQLISVTVHDAPDVGIQPTPPTTDPSPPKTANKILSSRNSISSLGNDDAKSERSLTEKVGKLLRKEPSSSLVKEKDSMRMFSKGNAASLEDTRAEETSLSNQTVEKQSSKDASKSRRRSDCPIVAKPLHRSKAVHRGSSINGDDFLRVEEEALSIAINMTLNEAANENDQYLV